MMNKDYIAIAFISILGLIVVTGITGVLFVDQPMQQSPSEAAFIDMVKNIAIFVTGALNGLLFAGTKNNNENDKDKK
jgi:hypothetical protein